MDLTFLTITGEDDRFSVEDESSWGLLSIEIERQQAVDEGRDFDLVSEEYAALKADLRDGERESLQSDAAAFLDAVQEQPYRDDFPYDEPDDLPSIKAERPDGLRRIDLEMDERTLADRIHGAWLGRCAGCLLGKPIEGWTRERLEGYLRDLDRYPLERYFCEGVSDTVVEEYGFRRGAFVDDMDRMPRDDDIDYTIMAIENLESNGPAFSPTDVATVWLSYQPGLRLATSDRIAYRNFLNLVGPPESATRRNPYREGIGGQIRTDAYGYVSPGNPELAAERAWRDASVSVVKNGIYGGMWVAAMLAATPTVETPKEAIEIGLTEIPANSRLAESVRAVLAWRDAGADYDTAVDRVHDRWDEERFYAWLHTIPNAMVVSIGLLWGEGDYGRSICAAVQAGFDTDCNGATVGSVMGMSLGASELPSYWTDPLHDEVETALGGVRSPVISELAERTVEWRASRHDA